MREFIRGEYYKKFYNLLEEKEEGITLLEKEF